MNPTSLPLAPGPAAPARASLLRPLILAGAALFLLYLFWVTSRYPQLLDKAAHINKPLASMAYGKELFPVAANAPVWERIILGALNWLDGMKIGMSFGVLFGALLHTYLRYYPLKIGRNLYLNSVKGALIGLPMGVCANCAVPMACGLTRGNGRVEVALGFLFSSPNFNPIVLAMTFSALPLAMALFKYSVLLAMILFVVPFAVGRLERDAPLQVQTERGPMGSLSTSPITIDPTRSFGSILKEVALDYGGNVWMLFKPTIVIMLAGSLVAASLIVLIPWPALLSQAAPWQLALVSLVSTFMPVPIALDVMFASQLLKQGVDPGYAMLFAMTLGTYSIIPSIYLWREVSHKLAVLLFAFFAIVGLICGLAF